MSIEKDKLSCPVCHGKGCIGSREAYQFDVLTFVVPKEAMAGITMEINRITNIAGINTRHPALNRGLALEYICQLSGQTPVESLL